MCYTNSMDTYPMRINKYLAHRGLATRKSADELITRGKVTINGRKAVLGDKINEKDIVEVSGNNTAQFKYFAYNKPVGVVSTNPQNGERSVVEMARFEKSFFPVGRLDKDSHGLIIITNDGRITDRLLNPENLHEKEYVVEVDHKYTPAFVRHMQDGIVIGEYKTKSAVVKKINDTTFSIILHEGKNRQIRKMTEKLGYTVIDLKRIRVQNIDLKKIAPNSFSEIVGHEKEIFLKSLGL